MKNHTQRFEEWSEIKKKIDTQVLPEFYVNQREIWYTKMGKNIGFEEDGKKEFLRPVVVLKKIGIVSLKEFKTVQKKLQKIIF